MSTVNEVFDQPRNSLHVRFLSRLVTYSEVSNHLPQQFQIHLPFFPAIYGALVGFSVS